MERAEEDIASLEPSDRLWRRLMALGLTPFCCVPYVYWSAAQDTIDRPKPVWAIFLTMFPTAFLLTAVQFAIAGGLVLAAGQMSPRWRRRGAVIGLFSVLAGLVMMLVPIAGAASLDAVLVFGAVSALGAFPAAVVYVLVAGTPRQSATVEQVG